MLGVVAMHDNELDIDADVVRALIAEQFPEWCDLPVRPVPTAATVNVIFRIGDSVAARFPLQRDDPERVREGLSREAAAGHEFHRLSPFPSPRPIGLGEPGHGYPLPWSLQTWLPGRDAGVDDPAGSEVFARDLVRLIAALRAADPKGRRFSGDGRGGHLPDHDDWVELCLARSEGLVEVAALRAMWAELRELPEIDDDVMCHGDLTPPNLLVDEGHIVGVLDSGGFAAADPALDLVSLWHLLETNERELVRRELGCSDVQWLRGMAWSLQQAIGLVWYYATSNPVMARWGRRTLDRLVADRPS